MQTRPDVLQIPEVLDMLGHNVFARRHARPAVTRVTSLVDEINQASTEGVWRVELHMDGDVRAVVLKVLQSQCRVERFIPLAGEPRHMSYWAREFELYSSSTLHDSLRASECAIRLPHCHGLVTTRQTNEHGDVLDKRAIFMEEIAGEGTTFGPAWDANDFLRFVQELGRWHGYQLSSNDRELMDISCLPIRDAHFLWLRGEKRRDHDRSHPSWIHRDDLRDWEPETIRTMQYTWAKRRHLLRAIERGRTIVSFRDVIPANLFKEGASGRTHFVAIDLGLVSRVALGEEAATLAHTALHTTPFVSIAEDAKLIEEVRDVYIDGVFSMLPPAQSRQIHADRIRTVFAASYAMLAGITGLVGEAGWMQAMTATTGSREAAVAFAKRSADSVMPYAQYALEHLTLARDAWSLTDGSGFAASMP